MGTSIFAWVLSTSFADLKLARNFIGLLFWFKSVAAIILDQKDLGGERVYVGLYLQS